MKTREGFVLPAVIFALAIMGLLAVVSLRTADDEHRSSRALRESGAALYAAEAGANVVRGTVTDTSGTTLLDSIAVTLAPGNTADLGWLALPDGASYRAVIQRVDNGGQQMYGLTVEGRGAGPWGGQRAVSVAFTASPSSGTPLSIPGAVTIVDPVPPPAKGDPLTLFLTGGGWGFHGEDTMMPSASDPANIPAGCSATPTAENKLGISTNSQEATDAIAGQLGSKTYDNFKGLLLGSTTNQYTDLNSYGESGGTLTAADLQALVDALTPGATQITKAVTSENFGTPTNPGVFWAPGYQALSGGGNGYGILIVEGVLEIGGGYEWEGLILAAGGYLDLGGNGTKVAGAVLVFNTNNKANVIDIYGTGSVVYSSQALCRVEQQGWLGTSGGSSSALALVPGSWMELSR